MKKKLLVGLMAFTFVLIALCGCFGGAIVWADNSPSKVGGITVSAEKTVSRKAFVEGVDSEARIQKFGELGALNTLIVKVSGEVEKSKAESVLTPITVEGSSSHITGENETPTYYTDYIKIKIKLPEGATRLDTLDGDGATAIDTAQSVEDGYYFTKVEWLKVDANKENYTIAGDSQTNDEFYYFAFRDDDNDLIADYLLRVVFDVKFK